MNPVRLARPQSAVHQLCSLALRQPALRQATSFATFHPNHLGRNPHLHRPCLSARHASIKTKRAKEAITPSKTVETAEVNIPSELGNLEKKINQILSQKESVPPEDVLVPIMREADQLAVILNKGMRKQARSTKQSGSDAVSLLSDLETAAPPAKNPAEKLSSLVHELMLHPPVFINPEMLDLYVKVQAKLHQPVQILDVFDLYANKPIPKPKSSPVQYKKPKPDRILAAIPTYVANQAVDAALANKDLFLAMEMVEKAFRTRAFNKAKLVRKVSLPLLGVGSLPIALYYLSQMYAHAQTAMEPSKAAINAYMGGAAYLASVIGLGFVALSTWNDHMQRVTWARGTPLSVRYMREEERAAVDRIALAVGFRDKSRWGEEEGEEWEAFLEWAALRWMVVDEVSLQEEMNTNS